MRFREFEKIIDENYRYLSIKSSDHTQGRRVTQYFSLITAINNIEKLGFIDNEIAELKKINTPFNVQKSQEAMVLDQGTFNMFYKNVQTIIDKCSAIKIAINTCLPKQNPLSITVGLPEIKSFEELAEFNTKLQKIFTVFLEDEADKVTVQNFDSGSLWTEIAFSSFIVMGSFGSLIALVSYLFITIRKHKIAEMEVDELEMDQDIKRQVKQSLLAKALKEIESDVEIYLTTDHEKPTPEKIASTTRSAMLLFDLLDQGTTFETAINTNKEIQDIYPSLTNLNSLPITAKLKVSGDVPKMISLDDKDIEK